MNFTFFRNNHTKEIIRLAWPLIITQVGHIITGMVDNIFLGQIGTTEQAAGILCNNLYVLLLVFSIGMSYAATPLVTNAHEQNDNLKKASLFKNSFFLNFIVSILCFLVLFLGSGMLRYMQQPVNVVILAIPFFDVLILSIIPLSVFFTCKQYCEGLSNTKFALIISVTGNIINIILNYVLIYGKFGFPELGYIGSAWASFYARLFMGLSFIILLFRSPLTKGVRNFLNETKLNFADLYSLWKIGINSALQFIFEVAAFAIAGLMAGSFGEEQIDAHGIALGLAAFTYMFGSGISGAATIISGRFKAQDNWVEINNSSVAAVRLVVIVMGFFGLLFFAFNNYLPLAFSKEAGITALASKLLIIAAMFQLFDGIQVTVIGILRGLEDVKIPTVITLIGYWMIALPLAYFMAFNLKLETIGIWIGLLSSLAFVAGCMLWRLHHLLRKNLLRVANA
jgi:multidrug resistance protein, MATE family